MQRAESRPFWQESESIPGPKLNSVYVRFGPVILSLEYCAGPEIIGFLPVTLVASISGMI
jgi:hypothetical protein